MEDSTEFEIGDLTCLVGKNESGKTAILEALHGIKSTPSFTYDRTRDYPRRYLNHYDERHPDGQSKVTITEWSLDTEDVRAIEDKLGDGALSGDIVMITSYIGRDTLAWVVPVDEKKCLQNLIGRCSLTADEKTAIKESTTIHEARVALQGLSEPSNGQKALLDTLITLNSKSATEAAANILSKRLPRFFYTSFFQRMAGEISLDKLLRDRQQGKVEPRDQIFLDFLEYAGTSIEELQNATKLEELKAKCEAASNNITDEIFEFWSQNDALEVEIDIGDGLKDDPPPFNTGRVAKIRIKNKNHRVSLPLSERSAGFIWFFSFIAQFKQLKKHSGESIILLDEPGLTLHGKAQSDLLRYINDRILPEHQVIYSTHSPFMVPVQHLTDVRVVEDLVDRSNANRPVIKGTKVSANVLSVDRDTIFPLQACLGYEITQSLFIGPNCLLVEGPSDIIYLQMMSNALQSRQREYLDMTRWTICPMGGLDKVASFASLFAGNRLNIVVFCDFGKGDRSKIERLRQSQILESSRILIATNFSGKDKSDVEDLFGAKLYCDLVNQALGLKGIQQITPDKAAKADPNTQRIVKQVERCLPPDAPSFNHFIPANWLLRNPECLQQDDLAVAEALDRFEKLFKAINKFLYVSAM
ncbi:hypothetical conserved protein [Candidatus Nitrosoglobus terrae]|uniref:Hypothetical conserved protein n=1 Tax=Candidatus Nitrosoglobus terrae TaxID=1630141 RepID=A0A1Q2SKA9_9GAMM|nr:hypothetical conserved protein [Candidatus Nitrosoglobus terrae]